MTLSMINALGLITLVAAIVAIVQEGKDGTVKGCAGLAGLLGLLLALKHHVGFVDQLLVGIWWTIIALASAILGVILVIRLRNQVIGTLLVTSGGLSALVALGVIAYHGA